VPLNFGVMLLIHRPIEWTSFNWMKLHKNFGSVAKSVEKIIWWLFGNIDYPVKIFKEEKR